MEPLQTWWATELYPSKDDENFGVAGDFEVVKAADAQATIAALQARVRELESQHEDLAQRNRILRHRPDLPVESTEFHDQFAALQSQLTQRTAELEAVQRKVDLAEKKAWLAAHDVGFFSMWNGTDHSGPPKLALLCNDTFAWATADAEDVLDAQIDTIVELFKSEGEAGVIKWIAQQRNMKPMESVGKWLFGCDAIKKERDDLQAELERVRERVGQRGLEVVMIGKVGHYVSTAVKEELERVRADNKALDKWRADVTVALQRPEGAFFVDVPQHMKDLVKERDDLRTLILTLPKVEGEITVSHGYVKDSTRCHALFGADEDAALYAALLRERQKLC